MKENKIVKLSDVCDLIPGFAFKSSEFGEHKVKAVKIGDIQPPYVNFESMTGVDISKYSVSRLAKYEIFKGDFVLAMTGATIGKIGRYIADTGAYINQRVLKFKPHDEVNSDFIYYVVSSTSFQKYILNNVDSETAQPNISAGSVGKYEFELPSLEEQNRIANILASIDNKIQLNRQINDNLEQQAQALYKSWFVDFEPFKDGDFVESELGSIPKGWKVVELGDVTKQITEKVKNRTDVKVLSPVTTGELVLSEEYFTKQVFSESIAKYIVVKPLQFAYNPARVNIGSLGMNTFEFDGCVSPVYVVFECERDYQYFFDYFRKTEAFKEEVLARAIGGVRQSLSYKDFSLIKLIYPPRTIVEKFNRLYSNILVSINHNKVEANNLTDMRDILLPKLMSGELKINEIDC